MTNPALLTAEELADVERVIDRARRRIDELTDAVAVLEGVVDRQRALYLSERPGT